MNEKLQEGCKSIDADLRQIAVELWQRGEELNRLALFLEYYDAHNILENILFQVSDVLGGTCTSEEKLSAIKLAIQPFEAENSEIATSLETPQEAAIVAMLVQRALRKTEANNDTTGNVA